MKVVRLDEMEQYILHHGTVSMAGLCDHFDVSMNTVRRDIVRLLERGTVEKVYGGVSARRSEQLTSFDVRTVSRSQSKMRIGEKAASFVEDGDIIFIDSGTTTMYVVQHIAQCKNVTILTNNLQCINMAMPYPNINVLILPGQLQRETNSFTGMDTITSLHNYHIKKAFMAASAISLTNGVTNSSSLEYEIKRIALQQSEKKYLLVDNGKFDRTAMLTYAQLSDFTCLVTDVPPPEVYRRACEKAAVGLAVYEERK